MEMRKQIVIGVLLSLTLLAVASVVLNGLLATDVIGADEEFDLNAYRAGVQEGYGECQAGNSIDTEILPIKTTIAGEEWVLGTTDFAYGYDVGFTSCQLESIGYDAGYSDGYADGDYNGYSDGYDFGYGDGQRDFCHDLVRTFNEAGIPLPFDCSTLQ
jgi:hypothetical protein